MEPAANQPTSKAKSQEKHRLAELCVSTALFLVLLMLTANVSVLITAQRTADEACRAALIWAQQAATEGRSKEGVMHAALAGLNTCGPSGFLVKRPEFVDFRDYRKGSKRTLRVRARALAKIPVPFLLPGAPFNQDGELSLARTYELELDCQSEHKAEGVRMDGKVK